MKIKDVFPKLSADKVSEIHKVINNLSQKGKLELNMTTKSLLRKQVIIPMRFSNSKRVITKANTYVFNINRLLKGVKSEISIDFI